MKTVLLDSGRFEVDVATAPTKPSAPGKPKKATPDDLKKYEAALAKYKVALEVYKKEMPKFDPPLEKCDVILSNYNGDSWPAAVNDRLERLLGEGKVGLVIVHAANNAFSGWKEYNLMIGMGWRGEKFGDRLKFDDKGEPVRVPPGKDLGSGHRYTGDFSVVVRDANHPVTRGMPREWKHAQDELYDNMRGPIQNVKVLATAYCPKLNTHEPMIWTVSYGKGRVFHTPMGHDLRGMRCVGFITTLRRGIEWAATGAVTLPVPDNFPTEKQTSSIPAK
jgi:hypothetical protein